MANPLIYLIKFQKGDADSSNKDLGFRCESFMKRKGFISLLLVLCMLYAVPAFSAKLLLWYEFDEGQGDTVRDSSGNNLTGEIRREGGAVNWVKGVKGNAIEFNPEPWHEQGHIAVWGDFSFDGISITCWIYSYKQTSFGRIFESGGPGDVGFFCARDFLPARGVTYTHLGSFGMWRQGGIFGDRGVREDDRELPDNKWVFVSWIFDGKNNTFYINNQPKTLEEVPGEAKLHWDSIRFGGKPTKNYPFRGIIDDCRLYSGVLTAEEIRSIAPEATSAVKPLGKLSIKWGAIKVAH